MSNIIDPQTKRRTLRGPHGIKLILDAEQVIPSNPGDGTPTLLENAQGETMTMQCAMDGNIGELLPIDAQASAAIKWLDAIADQVDAWHDYHWQQNGPAA
jgi:hypothetical protein